MPWVEFTGKKSKSSSATPTISISSGNRIGISRSAYEKHFSECKHVILAYDPTAKKIGIKPVDKESPNSYPIMMPKKRATGIYVVAKAFFDHFELGKEKIIFKNISKDHGYIVLNISEP